MKKTKKILISLSALGTIPFVTVISSRCANETEDSKLTEAKVTLKKYIDEVKTKELVKYSDAKFAAIKKELNTAISTAETVLNKKDVIVKELTDAKTVLEAAVKKAIEDAKKITNPTVDPELTKAKEALKNYIKEVKANELTKYEDSRFATVKTELNVAVIAAETIFNKQDATAKELTDAKKELENAVKKAKEATDNIWGFWKADVSFRLIRGLSFSDVTVDQINKKQIFATDNSKFKFTVNVIEIKIIDLSTIEIIYTLTKDNETSNKISKTITGLKVDFDRYKVQFELKNKDLFSTKKAEEITKDDIVVITNNENITAEILDIKMSGQTSIIIRYQSSFKSIKSTDLFYSINILKESQNHFSNADIGFNMKNGKNFHELTPYDVKPEDLEGRDRNGNDFSINILNTYVSSKTNVIVEYELIDKTTNLKSDTLYQTLWDFVEKINWNDYYAEVVINNQSIPNTDNKDAFLPSQITERNLLFHFYNKITDEHNDMLTLVSDSLVLTPDDDKGTLKIHAKFSDVNKTQMSEAYDFIIEGFAKTQNKELADLIQEANPKIVVDWNAFYNLKFFAEELDSNDLNVKLNAHTDKLKYEIIKFELKQPENTIKVGVKFSYNGKSLILNYDYTAEQLHLASKNNYESVTSKDGNVYFIEKKSKKVVHIDFKGNKKQLIFPDEALCLDRSFENDEIETIDLNNITNITRDPFMNQPKLKKVIGKKLKEIFFCDFESQPNPELAEFDIPDNVIFNNVKFNKNSKLVKSITKGTIKYWIFNNNVLFDIENTQEESNIELDDAITVIAPGFFNKVSTISGFSAKNLKVICDNNFSFGKNSDYLKFNIDELDLNSVEYLGKNCFVRTSGLKKLKLNTISVLNNSIFDCKDLEEIELNNTKEILEKSTFVLCPNIKKIAAPNLIKYTGAQSADFIKLADANKFVIIGHTLIKYLGNDENVVIPENVTSISSHAFDNNTNLKKIDLKNVESVDNDAFYRCKNLEKVTALHLSYVGRQAFYGCLNVNRFIYDKNVEFKFGNDISGPGTRLTSFANSSIISLID